MRIEVFAPEGIGEVLVGNSLAGLVVGAVASDPNGPLADGDIVVVTSKVVSKAEGRTAAARERERMVRAESTHTLAARGPLRIVRTGTGLVQAAAGVDNSNVVPERVLLLPRDPDASAAELRAQLQESTGRTVGVVISDTAGRAWRLGQTDHAIGAAGICVLERYAGRVDPYGNALQVTEMALGDELAAAADLVKGKLAGRPIAVVRGLGHLVTDAGGAAADLVRDPSSDLFGYGSREAVLAAVLAATGQAGRYEVLVGLPPDELRAAVLAGCAPGDVDVVERLLRVAASWSNPSTLRVPG